MCSICLHDPCLPGCPNAPEPKPVAYCRKCKEPMYAGDRHFDGICEACLDEMSTPEWLELFGEKMEIAKQEE